MFLLTKLNPVRPSLCSVEQFVSLLSNRKESEDGRDRYQLTSAQRNGFIIFMKNMDKYYMYSARDFVPYLDTYLGQD